MKIDVHAVNALKIDYDLFRITPEMGMTLKVQYNIQPTVNNTTPIAMRYFATYFPANSGANTERCEFIIGVIAMVEGYQDGMFDLVKPELVRASYPLFIKKMNEIAAVIDSSGTVFTLPNVDEAMKL